MAVVRICVARWCPEHGSSVLGNPKKLATNATMEERLANIENYRQLLWKQLQDDNREVVEELGRLYKVVDDGDTLELECWCAPLPCHADIIKRYLVWCYQQMCELGHLEPDVEEFSARIIIVSRR